MIDKQLVIELHGSDGSAVRRYLLTDQGQKLRRAMHPLSKLLDQDRKLATAIGHYSSGEWRN